MWVLLLASKDEVERAIVKQQAAAEVECGHKLRVLRTDRGGEFTSATFYKHFDERKGATSPHSPLLAAAEWRRRAEEPNGAWDGTLHAQGKIAAEHVLGGGLAHGRLHPQPLLHKERRRQDALQGVVWEEARCMLHSYLWLRRARQDDAPTAEEARRQEHPNGVHGLRDGL